MVENINCSFISVVNGGTSVKTTMVTSMKNNGNSAVRLACVDFINHPGGFIVIESIKCLPLDQPLREEGGAGGGSSCLNVELST